MFGKKKISIDQELYERIARLAETAGYASPDDFIVHCLESHARQIEEGKDEKEIKKRLKGLGYID